MSDSTQHIKVRNSAAERTARSRLLELFQNSPLPDNEKLKNLELFITRQQLSRMLFINDLYRRLVDVHGVIMEFGVRWGRNLVLYESLRGIYEPFNHSRKIIGFDTFEGFPTVHAKDGAADIVSVGAYGVTAGYDQFLKELLDCHEQESPVAHIQKYQLRKGDAVEQIRVYFQAHPETIVAFAYFDFDLYESTKACLEAIKDRVVKGSILAFDQLSAVDFPGETLALKDVLGLHNVRLQRSPFGTQHSFLVIE